MTLAEALPGTFTAWPRINALSHRIFAATIAVLWVHLIDASVVHPQAGAGPAEHAAQAFLALVLPPLAVAAYLRAGRWVRGFGAIAIGLPAFAAGATIHVVGAVKNGHLNADDFTGSAMAAAGLVLVALGVVTVVRAIPRLRYRFALILAAPFAFYWVVLPVVAGTYIAHAPRYEPRDLDMGAPHQLVAFTTSDGLEIHGSFVPSTNGATVIVIHGSGGARHRPIAHERMLVRNGFGVLAIDSRGHGESEGTTNALGWGAYPDVIAAADYLAARHGIDQSRIGVLGISMGGEVALDAATHGAPIAAVVSDGAGGRSINETLSLKRSWIDVIGLPAVAGANAVVSLLTGSLPAPSLESSVDRIAVPTFFISSLKVAEERDLNRIWVRNTTAPHQIWEVNAGHTGGLKSVPSEYERRVIGFLTEYLLTN